jgi:predicted Zn-dependent peptidase
LCYGGLNSKICKSLREDNQLCYSVSSINSKYDNLYYIYVSLDNKNVDLAIKLIKQAVEEMARGNISDDELATFRRQLLNSINMVIDNQNSLINNYTFHTLVGTPLLNELKEEYEKLTIEDLKILANKLKLNFIYIFEGKEK